MQGNASEEHRLRLFVAAELPDEWKQALAAESQALDRAAPGFARWVDPSLMHLTLVFLGGQLQALLPTVSAAIDTAAAGARPFTLSLDEPGSFGGPRSVRVVWVGVRDTPSGSLPALHRALVENLRAASIAFEADRGPFRAHLTLGRARRDATPSMSRDISAAIARRRSDRAVAWTGSFRCEEIVLMKSDPRPTGSIYTRLHRARLGSGR